MPNPYSDSEGNIIGSREIKGEGQSLGSQFAHLPNKVLYVAQPQFSRTDASHPLSTTTGTGQLIVENQIV